MNTPSNSIAQKESQTPLWEFFRTAYHLDESNLSSVANNRGPRLILPRVTKNSTDTCTCDQLDIMNVHETKLIITRCVGLSYGFQYYQLSSISPSSLPDNIYHTCMYPTKYMYQEPYPIILSSWVKVFRFPVRDPVCHAYNRRSIGL